MKRWVKVIEEGADEHLFAVIEGNQVRNAQRANQDGRDESAEDLGEDIMQMANCAEDIAIVRGHGFDVDDDNDCLPENIPVPELEEEVDNQAQTWGWNGLDERKNIGTQDNCPAIKEFSASSILALSYVGMFFMFFQRTFIENVIIAGTSKHLTQPLTLGEFLRWLGIWLLLSTIGGYSRDEF